MTILKKSHMDVIFGSTFQSSFEYKGIDAYPVKGEFKISQPDYESGAMIFSSADIPITSEAWCYYGTITINAISTTVSTPCPIDLRLQVGSRARAVCQVGTYNASGGIVQTLTTSGLFVYDRGYNHYGIISIAMSNAARYESVTFSITIDGVLYRLAKMMQYIAIHNS